MSLAIPSPWDRSLTSLAAFTRQLALPSIALVDVRMQFSEENVSYPAVIWTPEGEMEEDSDTQTWETVDVWFPCRCYVADRIDRGNEKMRAVLLGWRHRLTEALRRLQSLEGVPECCDVKLTYAPAVDPRLPQYATVVGAFTAKVLCRSIKPAEQNRKQTGQMP